MHTLTRPLITALALLATLALSTPAAATGRRDGCEPAKKKQPSLWLLGGAHANDRDNHLGNARVDGRKD